MTECRRTLLACLPLSVSLVFGACTASAVSRGAVAYDSCAFSGGAGVLSILLGLVYLGLEGQKLFLRRRLGWRVILGLILLIGGALGFRWSNANLATSTANRERSIRMGKPAIERQGQPTPSAQPHGADATRQPEASSYPMEE